MGMVQREEIVSWIQAYCKTEHNSLHLRPQPAWEAPLVGVASGADDYFSFFKKDIGSFYFLPQELLHKHFPQEEIPPEEVSVVSWVLPQTRATVEEQRRETLHPGFGWALARTYGEAFNRALGHDLAAWLSTRGIAAAAPLVSPYFAWQQSKKYGVCSNWSERHAAFVAGLGTFGLCYGLITAKGKAVRLGSAILRAHLTPTPRPYASLHAYCLYYQDGSCMACARRCPGGAIDEAGHHKGKCIQYASSVTGWVKEHYGFEGSYGCGLCQAGVPCERGIPAKRP